MYVELSHKNRLHRGNWFLVDENSNKPILETNERLLAWKRTIPNFGQTLWTCLIVTRLIDGYMLFWRMYWEIIQEI